ncbi:MAG: hydroxyacid dehydrogenase [Candidatus Yonathbacteria bacterium]|nr:hydroxyacid dehydrogenase [Candidatus Yonathbacteria bacterium]
MRIIFFYNEDWEAGYIKERVLGQDISFLKGTIADYPDLRDEQVEMISVFVNSRVGKNTLDKFPNLKHIVTRSTGFDHIDSDETKARWISVSYVPTYGQNTVAEFSFALLLALSRKILLCEKRVHNESLFSQTEELRGFDLEGKTMGVVGTGHIGQYVIRIAKGFGMNVVAFDAFPKQEMAEKLGFSYASLDELLAQSDVVSMHLPYMKETHHILNMKNIHKMKKGSILINTARGGLIETAAIAYGLREGIFSGAGLDVLEEEMFIEDETKLVFNENPDVSDLKITLENHYIIEHPRTIVSPHNAFNTKEAICRILDTTIENMEAYIKGEQKNLIPIENSK